jgi:Zn finger protein HypA/HybF involved in hydrogenase expression
MNAIDRLKKLIQTKFKATNEETAPIDIKQKSFSCVNCRKMIPYSERTIICKECRQ